jgi:hypothetical protein
VHGDDYVSFSELGERSPHAAEHGDLSFTLVQTDFAVHYGLSDTTEISVDVPYKWLSADSDLIDAHHRDESLNGFGDVSLRLKHFFITEEKCQVAAIFGVSIPTGEIQNVPTAGFVEHHEEEELGITAPWHSHLRLGTGTFDPILGIEAIYRFDERWLLFASASGNFPFYENRYDYQTGISGIFQAGPAVRIGDSPVVLGVFGEIFWSERDHFDGEDVVGTLGTFDGSFDVPNTGRFEVSIKPTVTWEMTDNLTLNVQGRFPLYTRIREGSGDEDVQTTEEWSIFAGLSYSF